MANLFKTLKTNVSATCYILIPFHEVLLDIRLFNKLNYGTKKINNVDDYANTIFKTRILINIVPMQFLNMS